MDIVNHVIEREMMPPGRLPVSLHVVAQADDQGAKALTLVHPPHVHQGLGRERAQRRTKGRSTAEREMDRRRRHRSCSEIWGDYLMQTGEESPFPAHVMNSVQPGDISLFDGRCDEGSGKQGTVICRLDGAGDHEIGRRVRPDGGAGRRFEV